MNESKIFPASLIQKWNESAKENIQRELAAFRVMLPDLLLENRGQFVALSEGKVIDHDANEFALAERVSQKFPGKFVLIQKVVETDPSELPIETVECSVWR